MAEPNQRQGGNEPWLPPRRAELSAVTAAEWHARARALRYETGHFIDGEHVPATADRFTLVNPATLEPLCEVADATSDEVERAVRAARRTFKSGVWRKKEPRARLEILARFASLIVTHTDRFALLDTLAMGKPISNMLKGDIPAAAETLRYFAELSDKIEGATTTTGSETFHYTVHEPLGVVACIVPWNYPLQLSIWKLGPALAAGNSVVLKPAEQAPLSALLMAELFVEAGGPPGVFNVVNGVGERCGAALALHMDVNKVAFTGSTTVGKRLLAYAGQSNMKRVSLECGGKSPQIFLRDLPDLDRAVDYAIYGVFANMGEVCSAASRLLVDKPLAEAFTARFIERGRDAFRAGDPLDPATNFGPLVSAAQRQRVLGYIERATKEGARLEFGGDVPPLPGCYVNPTLFSRVVNTMTIAREEIFGPVAAIIEVDGVDDAIAIANDSIYGLTASVWTRDLNTAHRAARALESGIVWVNCYEHSDLTQPWGGVKQSGQGREKTLESVLSYTEKKSVWIHLG